MRDTRNTPANTPDLTLRRTANESETETSMPVGKHAFAYVLHLKGSDVIGREAKLNITCPLSDDALDTISLRLYEPVALLKNVDSSRVFELTNNIESTWARDATKAGHFVKDGHRDGTRSTSVGDIVVLTNERDTAYSVWLCEGWGWTRYSTVERRLQPAWDFLWNRE